MYDFVQTGKTENEIQELKVPAHARTLPPYGENCPTNIGHDPKYSLSSIWAVNPNKWNVSEKDTEILSLSLVITKFLCK